jgi:hypothetical protein
MMYSAVRLGEFSPIKLKNQAWGYAFEERSTYAPHTDLEALQLEKTIETYELDPGMRARFLESLKNTSDISHLY